MKATILIFLLAICQLSNAQQQRVNFDYIDSRAAFVDSENPDTLAQLLTAGYKTDLEKVRSIFRWITEHISYKNVATQNANRPSAPFEPYETDSGFTGRPVYETIAIRVLKKRTAVCDGYARLFKTLCDYAGLKSEIISGFGTPDITARTQKFRSNHSWNAVYIDSNWYLLDVTWASGYNSFRTEDFVRKFNDYYFLTPPEKFILDHFPDDLQWTLLPNTPVIKEFYSAPYKQRSFNKYRIVSFKPAKGIIEAAPGDTVHIELETLDPIGDKRIASDPFFDTTIFYRSSAWAFLQPDNTKLSRRIKYSFVVPSSTIEWLHVMYNNDLVLRYRLNIRKDNKTAGNF